MANIIGLTGGKTAIKLLKQFGTLEELLSSIDQVSGKKLKEKLEENKEQAIMSKELATILREAPVDVGLDDLHYEGEETQELKAVFKDLGFNSLLEKMGETVEEETVEQEEISFEVLDEIKADHLARESSLNASIGLIKQGAGTPEEPVWALPSSSTSWRPTRRRSKSKVN